MHQLTRGSEGAIRELTAALKVNPNDLLSRWLLNIAGMTIGISKAVQKVRDIPVDKFFHVKEGKQLLDPTDLNPFAFRHIPEGPRHREP